MIVMKGGGGGQTYAGVRAIVHGIDCAGAESEEEDVNDKVIEMHYSQCCFSS